MITICAALEPEVSWLKERYELKKVTSDLFYSEENNMRLLITGIGPMRAAISVAALFGSDKGRDLSRDVLINIGSCGAECQGKRVVGEIYRINKISDELNHKTYYPDMIINTGFKEAEIVSDNKIFRYDKDFEGLSGSDVILHDEEASGIYLAAIRFLKQHNIIFLKVVSDDSLTRDDITIEKIKDVMEKSGDRLSKAIDEIKDNIDKSIGESDSLKVDEKLLCNFFKDSCASVTMQSEMMQYFRYAELEGIKIEDIIKLQYEKGNLPCRNKIAGKKLMKEIEDFIITQ